MTKAAKKINSLEKLQVEKQVLRTFCSYQEKLILYKFDYLKKNFPALITQEILPYTPEKNEQITSVLDFVNELIIRLLPARYRNNKLVTGLLKMAQALVIRGMHKQVKS